MFPWPLPASPCAESTRALRGGRRVHWGPHLSQLQVSLTSSSAAPPAQDAQGPQCPSFPACLLSPSFIP